MLWTLIWLAGVFLGYAIFMSQAPLRGYFSDAFNLVRERGTTHLWILAGGLSLAAAGIDLWRHYEDGARFSWGAALESPALPEAGGEITLGAARMVADLFSTIVAAKAREIGGGVRGVMVGLLGSLLLVSMALVLQYYVLLVLYVRISSPTKRVRVGRLLELALRRFGRTWPLLPVCWLLWALPIVGGVPAWIGSGWQLIAIAVFVGFAFLQVGVLSGERNLEAAIAFNFHCWRGGAVAAWFIVIVFVNLCVFTLAEVTVERAVALGSLPGIALKLAFVFGRSFTLLWLLAAWLLFFCDRFIGTKKPRPK